MKRDGARLFRVRFPAAYEALPVRLRGSQLPRLRVEMCPELPQSPLLGVNRDSLVHPKIMESVKPIS